MKITPIIVFRCFIFLSSTTVFCQPTIWGMTWNSTGGFGTIYKTPVGATTVNTLYTFTYTSQGTDPGFDKPVQAPNGKFYGLTSGGGANSSGVLYEYDPVSNLYTVRVHFSTATGVSPWGHLLLAANGKLYGLTSGGGSGGGGVLFEFDPATNTYTKKHDFTGAASGSYPLGGLVQATNGKLYGVTVVGGSSNAGVLFSFDITANTFTKHIDFVPAVTGSGAHGTLMEASNGLIYGLTRYGGVSGNGVIFSFNPVSNTLSKKFDFNGSLSTAKGGNPYGVMVEAANGKLYGMCSGGGSGGFGTLFEYNPVNDSCFRVVNFNGSNGKWPLGSLTKAADGNLYGLTWQGGSGDGNIIRYNPATNAFTQLHSFNQPDGRHPYGSLVQATNGKFYGVTISGGLQNKGVFFEYDAVNNIYYKVFDFNHTLDGATPTGALLLTGDQKLYGLTYAGGKDNHGVLFEFDHQTNTYTKKVDFSGPVTGSHPWSEMIEASNGHLYGMTSSGGAANGGTIFEYNRSSGSLTKKIDLTATTGRNPYGTLVEAANNKLYGLTVIGGTANAGALFEYDPVSNNCIKKIDFTGTANGSGPQGSLIQAANGKLYGMTSAGGTSNYGTLFVYDITSNTLTKKVDFTGAANGRTPYGDLVEAGNGKLYGLTHVGGSSNMGVIFEFDPATDIFTKKHDFAGGGNGSAPTGKLLRSSNGKLYGTTDYGGTSSTSVMFEYDPGTNLFTKLMDYTTVPATDLIEFCMVPSAATLTGGGSTVCSSASLTIGVSIGTVSGAAAYSFTIPATTSISAGAGSNSITIDFSGVPQGTYNIVGAGTNVCGGGESISVTVVIRETPTVTVNSGSICAGDTFTIVPAGAANYTIQGNTATVSPVASTSYSVFGMAANGCTAVAPAIATVTVHQLPSISVVSQPSLTCSGETTTVTATGCSTYTWNGSVGNSTLVGNPLVSTTYNVTGADNNGCRISTTYQHEVADCSGLSAEVRTVNVYPNPFSGNLVVSGFSSEFSYAISGIGGELIATGHSTGNELALDHLPAGMYFLKIESAERTAVLKVVKR